MPTHCTTEYYPWLLAWDYNFLPDDEGLHEVEELADNKVMVTLASFNIESNCLFICDREWVPE